MFLALALPPFFSPAIGKPSDKVGAKIIGSTGFLSLSLLPVVLGTVDHNDTEQAVLMCILLLLIGTSLNMILARAFSDVTYLVNEKEPAHLGILRPQVAYAQAFAFMGVANASVNPVDPLFADWVLERTDWASLTRSAGVYLRFAAFGGKAIK